MREAGVEPPAVTVVGDVVSVRDGVSGSLTRDGGTEAEAAASSHVLAGLPDAEFAPLEAGRGP